MLLQDKIKFCEEYCSFIRIAPCTKELLLSNDGKYMFDCKFKSGNFEADRGSLHEDSKGH